MKRSIFQTFWRLHCCAKFLFFELETSNFGSSYVFSSPLKWRGRFLSNMTFLIQNLHISGKILAKISCIYLKKQRFWNNGTCILPEICHFWVQNVNLGKNQPRHFNGLKKKHSWSKNLKSLAQKTKNRGNNQFTRRFGR